MSFNTLCYTYLNSAVHPYVTHEQYYQSLIQSECLSMPISLNTIHRSTIPGPHHPIPSILFSACPASQPTGISLPPKKRWHIKMLPRIMYAFIYLLVYNMWRGSLICYLRGEPKHDPQAHNDPPKVWPIMLAGTHQTFGYTTIIRDRRKFSAPICVASVIWVFVYLLCAGCCWAMAFCITLMRLGNCMGK